MTLKAILIGTLSMFIVMSLPAPEGACSYKRCHDRGCLHFSQEFSWLPGVRVMDDATSAAIKLLNSSGTTYERANQLVYLALFPAMALLAAWLRRERWWWFAAGLASLVALFIVGEYIPHPYYGRGGGWYSYCTEYCVRLGNGTGLTYRGVCFLIFVVGMPLSLLWDLCTGVHARRNRKGSVEGTTDLDSSE